MISAIFFVWFAVALIWTVNALRRPKPPGQGMAPLWLPGMIVSELAGPFLIVRGLVAALFLRLGAADLTIGKVGLALFVIGEVGLAVIFYRSVRATRALDYPITLRALVDVRDRTPSDELIDYEVPYAPGLTLNVHRGGSAENAPTLLYLHPGSWMRGKPGRQARPLVHRLVKDGWVVLDVSYPLSPAATFPDHVIGVKRAIAWARDGGARYGIDPARIAVSGGSAGAHLAAVAALTPGVSALQPGFEDADVSVLGCVPFYGIFDLLNRNATRHDWPFVAKYVMKSRRAASPELYRLASPLDLVSNAAPPFHIVHGEFDSVVLPAESVYLNEALQSAGATTTYIEVGAAQHGFDGINGLRAKAIAAVCADWLNKLAAN